MDASSSLLLVLLTLHSVMTAAADLPAAQPSHRRLLLQQDTNPAAYLSRSMRWLYMVVLPAVALLSLAGLACWLLCRKSAVATIGPWKTGLSGQLQKAFVTGIYCYRIGVLYLLLVGSHMCSKLYYILFLKKECISVLIGRKKRGWKIHMILCFLNCSDI